jgi:hypothetical protein
MSLDNLLDITCNGERIRDIIAERDRLKAAAAQPAASGDGALLRLREWLSRRETISQDARIERETILAKIDELLASQPESKSDAGLRPTITDPCCLVSNPATSRFICLRGVVGCVIKHEDASAPAAPVVPAVEDDETLRKWLRFVHPADGDMAAALAELCRRALKEKP